MKTEPFRSALVSNLPYLKTVTLTAFRVIFFALAIRKVWGLSKLLLSHVNKVERFRVNTQELCLYFLAWMQSLRPVYKGPSPAGFLSDEYS